MKIEIPDSLVVIVNDDSKCIKIWPFDLAPKKLQDLSDHGGDEDWLAFIPYSCYDKGEYIGFLDEGGPFGYCRVRTYRVANGEVRIGAHS